ncbi:unnamed protein product [Lathyrus oleraceus]
MMKKGIILLMFVAMFTLFSQTYGRKIDGRPDYCTRGVMLSGLCGDGSACADAVREKYAGVEIRTCSCHDTPIKLAFCSCDIIC